MNKNIIKNFFSFSVGTWIGAIIGLITIPILTNFFSPEDFAKASMYSIILNALVLIVIFGIDQAFIRFYYEEKTKILLYRSLIITTTVSIIIFFLIMIFRKEISLFILNEYVPSLMILLGLAAFISVLNSFAVSIIRMEQKGFLYSIIQISLRLFELIFVVMLLFILTRNYSIMIYGKILTLVIVTLFAIYLTRDKWSFRGSESGQAIYSYKDILNFSYPLLFAAFINWAILSIDKIALKQWSTLTELGIYVAAFKIVLILQMVQTSFTTYWIPLSYERFLKNENHNENKRFFSNVNQLVSALLLTCGVVLIIFKNLITMVLGSEYGAAQTMIPFLVLMPIMYTISESTTIGLNFFKKVKVILLISVITLIVSAVGNYFLIKVLHGIGAAMATGISSIVYYSLRTYLSLRFYKVDFKMKRFYTLLGLLLCYILYNTFYQWNVLNPLLGTTLIIIIIFTYRQPIAEFTNGLGLDFISRILAVK